MVYIGILFDILFSLVIDLDVFSLFYNIAACVCVYSRKRRERGENPTEKKKFAFSSFFLCTKLPK
jgi:hypothetical protein